MTDVETVTIFQLSKRFELPIREEICCQCFQAYFYNIEEIIDLGIVVMYAQLLVPTYLFTGSVIEIIGSPDWLVIGTCSFVE